MDADDAELLAETVAQTRVVSAAWRFLKPFYEDKDLAAAWPHVDPTLRLCWAQWWAEANRPALEGNGLSVVELAQALADSEGQHRLWRDFERVIVREFQTALPLDPETWGIGGAPRVMAVDVELLYVHREVPANGAWAPGAAAEVVPLLMRLSDDRWRVLNLGYGVIPQPGWPPTLG